MLICICVNFSLKYFICWKIVIMIQNVILCNDTLGKSLIFLVKSTLHLVYILGRNWTFLKMVTICYKNEKNPSKLAFLQDFRFYQRSTHNEKINTCRTNCHIFTELTTKILLKPIVIFPPKLLNFSQEFIPSVM